MQLELFSTKKKYETVRELLSSRNILYVYQINILNNTILMHQISTKTAPQVYFYPNSKNLHICIVLDCLTLITLSQLIKLINVSFGFQLEDLLSLI